MRQIKFKANRLDNGEWVEGDLLHKGEEVLIRHTAIIGGKSVLVNPSTVCQFTGLKDKDGKEIWEHDYIVTPCFSSEITCVRGSFVMEIDVGLTPLINLYATEDNILKYVENKGSKFDRKEGEK